MFKRHPFAEIERKSQEVCVISICEEHASLSVFVLLLSTYTFLVLPSEDRIFF